MKTSATSILVYLTRTGMVLSILLSTIFLTAGAALPAGAESAAGPATASKAPDTDILGPFVGQPVYPTVFNGDLRDLPQLPQSAPSPLPLRYAPGQEPKGSASQAANWVDGAAQTSFSNGQMPGPIQNFAGLDFNTFGAGWPPDTNGDVSPNHYIQTVNTSIGIYDKTNGNRLVGLSFDSFFTGPASTPCDDNNQGDPVVVYDASVDRWLITDFAWDNFNTGPFYECLAVSQSNDPVAGGWYFYALRADTGGFTGYLNDYPKIGVWSDGWYMAANMFQQLPPSTGFGVRVWALDRTSLIAGGALNEVHFDTCFGGVCDSLLPSNYRGTPPPAGAPNYFLGAVAPDALNLFKFHVDWVTPVSSTLTGPIAIPVAPFAIAPSIPQQGTGQTLDSLSFRLMMQLQYKNINGVESLWANHTVTSGGVVGVRWYEIQDPDGAANLIQQGTYQPDQNYRWMGSLAVDQDGNMALGYSVSSTTMFPAMRYAGRLAGEAPGSLPQNEATLIAGTGSQTANERWGDYSAMTLDPDGCTFWYTTEYYITTGFNWQTRIGSFTFPSCGQPKGNLNGIVYNSVTNQPVGGIPVTIDSPTQTVSIMTDSSGYYTATLVAGSFDVTAGPLMPGYPISSTVTNVGVSAGSTTLQDLFVDPVPNLVGGATQLDDNVLFGNNNGFPEPGERGLRLYHELENNGAITSTQVTAQLFALTSGVTVTLDQTAYPDIAAGVTISNPNPYEFSIDPSVVCGTDLLFHVVMSDSLSMYSSDFTLNASVSLPRADVISNTVESGAMGWTTGGTLNTWAITTLDAHSPTHSWTDSPGGNYSNNTNSYLRTPAMDFTGKRKIQISGWYKYELETGYDYVYLEYSLDGGTTWNSTPLTYFNGSQTNWQNVTLDASVLDDQPNVALRYRLVSDPGVTADGIYIDDVAISYEPYSCIYVPPTPPGAPNLISPVDNASLTNPVVFSWEDSGTGDAPTGYIFQLDNSSVMTFTTPVTTTTMTLTTGTHVWDVIAYNLIGSSPASITRTLDVLPEPPGVPNLLSPDDQAIVAPGMITFTWEDSGTGGPASGYHFILTGTQVITLTTAVTSTSMSLTPGMYTWSVSAFNDGGSSAYASDRNLLVEHRVFLPLILK